MQIREYIINGDQIRWEDQIRCYTGLRDEFQYGSAGASSVWLSFNHEIYF